MVFLPEGVQVSLIQQQKQHCVDSLRKKKKHQSTSVKAMRKNNVLSWLFLTRYNSVVIYRQRRRYFLQKEAVAETNIRRNTIEKKRLVF